MSHRFRPVKERWYEAAHCFAAPKVVVALLQDLAARADTASSENCYGDNIAVWLEDGVKVLQYIEKDERFNSLSFKGSLEEQGVSAEQSDLAPLVQNMKSLAREWRNSLGAHGELVFYVDAC